MVIGKKYLTHSYKIEIQLCDESINLIYLLLNLILVCSCIITEDILFIWNSKTKRFRISNKYGIAISLVCSVNVFFRRRRISINDIIELIGPSF